MIAQETQLEARCAGCRAWRSQMCEIDHFVGRSRHVWAIFSKSRESVDHVFVPFALVGLSFEFVGNVGQVFNLSGQDSIQFYICANGPWFANDCDGQEPVETANCG